VTGTSEVGRPKFPLPSAIERGEIQNDRSSRNVTLAPNYFPMRFAGEIQSLRHAGPEKQSTGPQQTYLLVLPWDLHGAGGVNQAVRSLYDGISRDGRLIPRVLVLSWEALTPVEEFDATGRSVVRFRVMGLIERGWFLASVVRYLLLLPRELWRLRGLVKRYRVAVVNCHYIGTSEITWVIAKMLGIFRGNVILSLHGTDIRTLARLTGIRRKLWRWTLQRADAVVACSEGLAIETMNDFRLQTRHVVTIHNGVDCEWLAKLLEPTDSTPLRHANGPSLLTLGALRHVKGHDLLLRAFRNVVDKLPNAHLTIMGPSAEAAASTLRLVQDLGLNDHVTIRLETPHDVALSALIAADVFVLSSRNEAFSISLLEAGAFGKPIVATDVCGVAELIEDRVTGILVPSESVDGLTQGILAMLDDPRAALEYGRRLRERVSAKFSTDQTCRNYLRLAGYTSVEGRAKWRADSQSGAG
jgi:glycosyltransferase involved in cell wall biosynthesis